MLAPPLGNARKLRVWGYDRIMGALANFGHALSDQTDGLDGTGDQAVTHAEFLHHAVAEIAEELPGFDDLDSATQQSLRELGEHYQAT